MPKLKSFKDLAANMVPDRPLPRGSYTRIGHAKGDLEQTLDAMAIVQAGMLERTTVVKPREPKSIHAEVKSRSTAVNRPKSKRKEAGKGMHHSGVDPSLATQNGHLYRFYGFVPK